MDFFRDNYIVTKGHGKDFSANIDLSNISGVSFHEESKLIAQEINDKKIGKIYLLYSGGIDSEYVLSVFLELKIEIIPVIIKLSPSYNDHDIKYAFEFCKAKKLNPIIIDIDFDDFVKSGKIVDVALAYKNWCYPLMATAYASTKIDGTLLLAVGATTIVLKNKYNGKWFLGLHETNFAWCNWFIENKMYGIPYFINFSPNQFYSWITDPFYMDKILTDTEPEPEYQNVNPWGYEWISRNSLYFKSEMYQKFSKYDLAKRPKFIGYEIIRNSEIIKHENFKIVESLKQVYDGECLIEYQELLSKFLKKPT
jgi:hypothetical protein